jgi:hypothetical protein
MATVSAARPSIRADDTTRADEARWNERLASMRRVGFEVAAIYALVGPANVRLPVVPRQTRFPKLP